MSDFGSDDEVRKNRVYSFNYSPLLFQFNWTQFLAWDALDSIEDAVPREEVLPVIDLTESIVIRRDVVDLTVPILSSQDVVDLTQETIRRTIPEFFGWAVMNPSRTKAKRSRRRKTKQSSVKITHYFK
jgi:hypothetical protein